MSIGPLVPSASSVQTVLAQIRSHPLKEGIDGVNRPERSGPADPPRATSPSAVLSKSFSSVLQESLEQVNASQEAAKQLGERFARGDEQTSLSDALLASQKASLSLQTAVQFRNRFVAAYQNIMNMQV
jgi:flagellar hook-basal body complex protein FliE